MPGATLTFSNVKGHKQVPEATLTFSKAISKCQSNSHFFGSKRPYKQVPEATLVFSNVKGLKSAIRY